jgi:hypothetical protein
MARQQLLVLLVLGSLLVTCPFPWLIPMSSNDQGTLEVTITYRGDYYVDHFDYSPEAENFRHFVLVRPVDDDETPDDAGQIFSSLAPQENGSLVLREDRQDYAWALDYIYDAPQGHFQGEFEPGEYAVAAAFIIVPSHEEAGVADDVILLPGAEASTDYQYIRIETGETTSLNFYMSDDHSMACPWLYVSTGGAFERRFEILRNVRDHERTEITPLGPVTESTVTIRIAEEKDEITYLDAFYLEVDGVAVVADNPLLAADDDDYLILHQGESVDLQFVVPPGAISVVAVGYYVD